LESLDAIPISTLFEHSMSRRLIDSVRAALVERPMVTRGDRVVVAVSGGPDSLCLLHILHTLRADLGITLYVAHLDHMLRGAESAADAAFVATTAQEWELPATVAAIDVGALARETHENLHQAGRTARYTFLARVAHEQGAHAVAVAHNADDQAETVLMHLLRGAGPAGLRGIRPVVPWEEWQRLEMRDWRLSQPQSPISNLQSPTLQPRLIRPLLLITRAEIEGYCAEQGLVPRRDPTNLDRRATRNRIRHELLPFLIEYNPHIVAALGRTALVTADEHDLVLQTLHSVWPRLVLLRPDAIDFVGAAWQTLHPALQRAALRRAYALLGGEKTLELEQIEAARALVAGGVGGRTELPGGIPLTVSYGGTFTIGALPTPTGPQLPGTHVDLPIPGRVALAGGWTIAATSAAAPIPAPESVWEIYLDAEKIAGPLLLRRRRAGDRLRPAGGRGSRRLQDMFVDAKVPRMLRDLWPLVATSTALVWVPGLRPPAEFLATPATQRVVHLQVIGPDGEEPGMTR
jgi:tRNA(Ile)-lysidine synthetase-like protein